MATDKIEKLSVKCENALERNVREWINAKAEDYNGSGVEGVLLDLQHGCSSGMVSHLLYTRDCVAFYKNHAETIGAMLAEVLEGTGCRIDELFDRAGWDKADPLAHGDQNQNILAWFGFEEAARILADRAGIEL